MVTNIAAIVPLNARFVKAAETVTLVPIPACVKTPSYVVLTLAVHPVAATVPVVLLDAQ